MKTPHKCRVPGLNIGCTSFIIPDYYVPAIRECVHYADDVALLLLEAGDCGTAAFGAVGTKISF